MQRRPWDSTAYQVPLIGQGTWYLEEASHRAALAALRRGLDLGMTHIDTAEMYGAGEAERIVGEAIAGRREEAFLVSKVLPQNASRAGTRAACERSLARLRTDRLDCYLLHWRGRYALEETVAGFDDLRRAGMILSWGVSNFDVEDLEELHTLAGGAQCACNQVLYNLEERAVEHAVLPWCEQHRISVTAYSPFGHSRFPAPRSSRGRVLAQIAAAHGATPRQVALAFLTRRPTVLAIPKASSIAHVEENAAAGDLLLSEVEVDSIDAAFPLGSRPVTLPTL
ncbi:MAG TPA: aldo/keto reductase [Steroidobacteraceae bacterium]|nr:aldo/keto reductase [Steroidobacteraceae bacterium]